MEPRYPDKRHLQSCESLSKGEDEDDLLDMLMRLMPFFEVFQLERFQRLALPVTILQEEIAGESFIRLPLMAI